MGLEVCLQHSEECGAFYKSLKVLENLSPCQEPECRVLALELGLPRPAV